MFYIGVQPEIVIFSADVPDNLLRTVYGALKLCTGNLILLLIIAGDDHVVDLETLVIARRMI